jgi:hypothetical protein
MNESGHDQEDYVSGIRGMPEGGLGVATFEREIEIEDNDGLVAVASVHQQGTKKAVHVVPS